MSVEEIGRWTAERQELKSRLMVIADGTQNDLVGGVDLSFIVGDNTRACAAYVVCRLRKEKGSSNKDKKGNNNIKRKEEDVCEVVYEDLRMVELTAPYVPGFLAFREAEPLASLIEDQRRNRPELTPWVTLVDGNGLLHADRFGLACHLGVLVDAPTIGVAKNLYHLEGLSVRKSEGGEAIRTEDVRFEGERVGEEWDLTSGDETLGLALWNCEGASKPVFVSLGHKVDLRTAREVVMKCSAFRVPEPIRQADIRSREFLRLHKLSQCDINLNLCSPVLIRQYL